MERFNNCKECSATIAKNVVAECKSAISELLVNPAELLLAFGEEFDMLFYDRLDSVAEKFNLEEGK